MNNSNLNGLVESKYADKGNKIHSTKDYTIFKFRKDNREINRLHVTRLSQLISLSNDLHLHPLIVNKDMEVVDGQHRLMAAKSLGLEVYYLIDENYTPQKMIDFNTSQKNWVVEDYLNYWISYEREDYVKLKEFQTDIGFPVHLVLSWTTYREKGATKSFRTGAFKFHLNENILTGILCAKKLITFLKKKNFKPLSILNQKAFHDAMKKFFAESPVDIERFFQNLESVPFELRSSAYYGGYFEQLVEIYNYNKKTKAKVINEGGKYSLVI